MLTHKKCLNKTNLRYNIMQVNYLIGNTMKKITLALIALLFSFSATTSVASDMTLMDLFGEAPKREVKKEQPKKEKSAKKKEANKPASEEKVKVDEEGVFSFLNFSFLRNKEKAKEFVRQKEETQETFVERMERLGEEGDIDACLTLGYMYLYGENGVERDDKKAFKYYSMAASMDDMIAINNVGSLYFSGIGTEKSALKAAQMFDKAARLGNHEAALNLAIIYLMTPDVTNVKSTIIELLKQSAEGGSIAAQHMMGYSYLHGFEVPKDDMKAFEYFRSAAEEYDEAQYEVAMRYIRAEGTPRNYGNAVRYLSKSAHQGNVKAMMTLGNILAAGTAYPKNEYQAYIWFNIASVYKADGAAERRDILEKVLKIDEVLQAQTASESFSEKPTEVTQYIRQTFGKNLSEFIDNRIPKGRIR